jgi:hypothetical protein
MQGLGLLQGVLVTNHPLCSIIAEDCVFETTLDSPVMSGLVVCAAQPAGQVGLQDCDGDMHLQCFGAGEACSTCHQSHKQTLNRLLCRTYLAAAVDHNDQLQVLRVQACCASPE